ncbi:hypothetical protein SpCBS45565_g08202 [Spizellomyces sp. 'palustris']|nr:hypothetical protein SpCBS45565_g08202 [Spizellomyces sp. 'palustris']
MPTASVVGAQQQNLLQQQQQIGARASPQLLPVNPLMSPNPPLMSQATPLIPQGTASPQLNASATLVGRPGFIQNVANRGRGRGRGRGAGVQQQAGVMGSLPGGVVGQLGFAAGQMALQGFPQNALPGMTIPGQFSPRTVPAASLPQQQQLLTQQQQQLQQLRQFAIRNHLLQQQAALPSPPIQHPPAQATSMMNPQMQQRPQQQIQRPQNIQGTGSVPLPAGTILSATGVAAGAMPGAPRPNTAPTRATPSTGGPNIIPNQMPNISAQEKQIISRFHQFRKASVDLKQAADQATTEDDKRRLTEQCRQAQQQAQAVWQHMTASMRNWYGAMTRRQELQRQQLLRAQAGGARPQQPLPGSAVAQNMSALRPQPPQAQQVPQQRPMQPIPQLHAPTHPQLQQQQQQQQAQRPLAAQASTAPLVSAQAGQPAISIASSQVQPANAQLVGKSPTVGGPAAMSPQQQAPAPPIFVAPAPGTGSAFIPRKATPPPIGEELPQENPDAGTSSPMLTLDSVLGKRKLSELVEQIDPSERLEPETEEFLLHLADDFILEVTKRACKAAKHRGATALGIKDLQLELERNWNLRIPGFANEVRPNRRPVVNNAHLSRLGLLHKQRHLDNIKRRALEQKQSSANVGTQKLEGRASNEAASVDFTAPSADSKPVNGSGPVSQPPLPSSAPKTSSVNGITSPSTIPIVGSA